MSSSSARRALGITLAADSGTVTFTDDDDNDCQSFRS